MSIELKVPSFGESITDVVIGEWLVAPGDTVSEDDPLVSIESDKITAELPAPASGVLTEILKQAGEAAVVGEILGRMEAGNATKPPIKESAAGEAAVIPAASNAGEPSKAATNTTQDTRVMPAAQRLLDEHAIPAGVVRATGPGGRLLKEDVLRHLESPPTSPANPPATNTAFPDAPVAGPRQEEIIAMTPMRRTIARRLVESQQSAALLTTFNEVDMTAIIALRREFKESFAEKYNVKLGFMSFFVKATIEALKTVPGLNAEIRGDDIAFRNYYDIGVAIGGGKGLVVPILRSAERKSFAEIEQGIGDFAARAKNGKLKLEELQNGTFTISNGGVYGSLLSTPIVNPPQSGVLGLHRIQERPVAIDGQVVIRPMMYLALTYDHRIVDGREGVVFLLRVKECIENPARMLLEV